MKTKNFFKWLCCSAILLIASVQPAWTATWSFSGGNAYFDNSKTGWTDSYIYMAIGKSDYTSTYQMKKVSNTKLLVINFPSSGWGDATYICFFGNGSSSWTGGAWGYSNISDHAPRYTGQYTSGVSTDGKYYLFTPSSSAAKGASISMSYLGTGNSNVQYKQTIKVKVGSSEVSSSPAKISFESYYMSDWDKTTKGTSSISKNGSTASIEYNVAITAPVTLSYSELADGYQFDGWFVGSSSSAASTSTSYTYDATAAQTVYAKFSLISYSITYKDQGGATFSGTGWGSTGTHPASYNVTTSTITLAQPTKTGYTFGGWYTASDCTGDAVTQITKGSTGNKTLYAKWTPKTYTLYLANNDGSDDKQTVTVTYNSNVITETINTLTRTGYNFGGWQTNTTGGNLIINSSGVLQANKSNWTDASGNWIRDVDNETIYGKWTEKKYPVTVSAGTGGSVAATSVEATYFTPVALPKATPAEGYHFVNWTASSSKVTITNPTSADGASIACTGTDQTVTANFALDATFDLTVVAGNGVSSVTGGKTGQASVPFDGGTITATMKPGYDFVNWTADPVANAEIANASLSTTTVQVKNGSVTVTANAAAHNYTITYNNVQPTEHTNPATYTIETATINLSNASRANYTFDGWYDAETGGNQVTQIVQGSTGDKTLWARWSETLHSVNIVSGTGIESVSPAGATNVGNVTPVQISATVKVGYTWKNWTTDNSSNVTITDANANPTTIKATGTGSVTATATENMTTVTVNANQTSWGTISGAVSSWGVTTTAGVATSRTLTATAKTGYKFVNWTLDGGATSTSTLTNAQITIKGDGSSATGTATAVFEEDLSSNWYLVGNTSLFPGGWDAKEASMMKRASGHSTENVYYFTVRVKDADIATGTADKHQFKIHHYKTGTGACDDWFGWGNTSGSHYWVNGDIKNVEIYKGDNEIYFIPNIAGDYEFKVDATGSNPKLTVTWPIYNCVYGAFNDWNKDANKLEFAGGDVASTVVNITDVTKSYEFLVLVNSNYFTYKTVTITRGTASNVQFASKADADANAKFTPDVAGDYTFTYNKATNRLTITYPALPTPSTTATEKRMFNENELSFIDSGDGTEGNPYKIYTDEALTIDITALAAQTNLTAKYQFGEEAATTDVLSKTITNPSTTSTSIVVKAFYESDGVAGPAWEKTIYYQGVAYPQLFLTSNLTNDETELDQAPDNVTISYMTANYTGSTTITKNGDAWKTATGSDQHYEEPLEKEIHADSYVATAEVNGRTFTTSLVVSVYKYVEVKVKDANPKWAKNVYMWKDGTDKKNAEWPGEALTTQLGDWYIFAVKYPTYDYFVINDGQNEGNQTIDLEIPNYEICYEIGVLDHDGNNRHYYKCAEAAQCPNKLFVGNIDDVEMYNGESTTVSPVVQLDPSLSEDNLHINFSYSNGGIVNAAQSGKNIMLSATSTGTTTVTATYSINGAQSVSKNFTVTVTGAVLIQVSITTSLDWNNKDEIYIKYFKHGLDSEKKMKWDHFYDNQDYYSARIPVGSDGMVDFMIHAWQIENEHFDHQTVDVQDVSGDGCYCVLTDQESNQKRKMRYEGSLCWDDYQVKIVMGNGTTYYSNKVNNLNEIVSFYAPADNEQGYKHGNVYLTHNGVQVAAITGFAESNVYTAKVADNELTDINVYDGPFYIRTNATSWDDYKKVDYQMNEFSLYNGAQYNYYWVGNHKSSGSFNIKGCVANQYNESLANMIETDTYTDGYGNIQNDQTLGVNLRFGYNPQTNHFERSILKGSSDNEFLNVIGDNIYNEVGCTTKLNQQDANSKFSDMSNWVYEKVVYAKIGEGIPEAPVKLLSKAFNGTVVYQFGYTIDPNTGQKTSTPATRSIMATGTTAGTYQLRLIYDYKTNRLTAAWSPADNQQIDNTITVNADIMFMQKEHNDATRLLMGENGKVKSLEYLLFILQIKKDDTRSGSNNNFEHYYISLPYDCMIQDIYGIEGFGEYWGIQKYDGAERAKKGWFKEDTPEGFWKWMNRDEKLNGGEGYLLSVAKGWLKEDNKFSTIEDTDGEEISALRLYFPSYTKGYDLSMSSAEESKKYPQQRCEITSPVDRRKEDSNWRMIGSTAYNDITTETVSGSADDDHKLAANYLYVLQEVDNVWKYVAVSGAGFTYKAFQGYMYQFEGYINWQRYTKGEEEHPASAPHYEAKRPAEKMRLSVMENNMEVAHTFVELNENATKEFDFNLDLAYLASGDMDLYTEIENAHLAANVTDYESQVIALHVDPAHYGTYTFHLDGANNVAVYLLDNMNGTYQLLSAGDVTVELEEGSSNDRFALHFDVAAVPTDIKNAKGETIVNDGQKTQKLLINGNIYLINGGRVYNATGAELR